MSRKILIVPLLIAVWALLPGSAFTDDDAWHFVRDHFGAEAPDPAYHPDADINQDGIVDGEDLLRSPLRQPDRRLGSIPFESSHVLVRFRAGLSVQAADELLREINSRRLNPLPVTSTGYDRVLVPDGESVASFVQRLNTDPQVMHAQPNYICRILDTPNDSFYRYQWNFDSVDIPDAWDLTQGGHPDVVVAVVDTGVAYEDYGEYRKAKDFAQTHFVAGYDFINSDDHPNDDEGHGTHVAGTIAQSTNNGYGVAGIAFECAIMPVKSLGDNGSGTSLSLSEGIRWAVDHGAHVINMSLGFPVGVNPGQIIEDAINYAYSHGVICVAATGNDADSPGYHGGLRYPAEYEHCAAVGAIRFDQRRAYYSNWGNGILCVAPGGDLRVDQNNDGQPDGILQETFSGDPADFAFYFAQGTSMASPHVAAAAALFVSRKGGGPDAFVQAVRETCQELGPAGYDVEYGFGKIDVDALVRKATGWGSDS